MGKAKVTFGAIPLVAVRVRGEGGGFGVLPRDDGLVGELQQWMSSVSLHPFICDHVGPGIYLAYFEENDAAKVRDWLKEHGVVDDVDVTWEKRS